MEPVKPTPGKLGSEFRAPETLLTAVPALVEPKFAGFEFGDLDDLTIGRDMERLGFGSTKFFCKGFVVRTAGPPLPVVWPACPPWSCAETPQQHFVLRAGDERLDFALYFSAFPPPP